MDMAVTQLAGLIPEAQKISVYLVLIWLIESRFLNHVSKPTGNPGYPAFFWVPNPKIVWVNPTRTLQRMKLEYGGRSFQLWNNEGSDDLAVESSSSLHGISVYL